MSCIHSHMNISSNELHTVSYEYIKQWVTYTLIWIYSPMSCIHCHMNISCHELHTLSCEYILQWVAFILIWIAFILIWIYPAMSEKGKGNITINQCDQCFYQWNMSMWRILVYFLFECPLSKGNILCTKKHHVVTISIVA